MRIEVIIHESGQVTLGIEGDDFSMRVTSDNLENCWHHLRLRLENCRSFLNLE